MSANVRGITFYERLQRHVSLAWYPISISFVMFGLFSTFGLAAGQVQEALANYVSDRAHPWSGFEWTRAAITFLAVFMFASTLRYWTARLLGIDLRGVHTISVLNTWQKVFIGIAWFAPWLGAALSFMDAAVALLGVYASPERSFGQDFLFLVLSIVRDPLQTPFACLAIAAVVAPVIFLAFWWSPLARLLHRMTGHWIVVRAIHGWTLPAIFIGFTALYLFMPSFGIDIAREMGPIPLICISFAVVTAAGSWLIAFGRAHGLPAFPFAAAVPLVLGSMSMDDNHFMRQLGETRDLVRPTATEALGAFNDDRPREPIILISTEGGGIRAAHFTATVLARMADQCPRLARRIFVISSVSGGAVGAAAYRASLDAMPLSDSDACSLDAAAPAGPRQLALNAMFERDHLSPGLAKQMFPELVQSFAPASMPNGDHAFVPQTDRQLGLELSLETAFADAFGINARNNPFAASVFGDEEPADAPHLLMNMTEVSSGAVFVAGTLDLASMRDRHRWLHDFRCLWTDPTAEAEEAALCNTSPDFRLSTIATTSARFPMVSPAGAVRARDATFRFVDGGYFDNSGVETLLGVIEHLQRQARESDRPLPPIAVLHIDSNPYTQRLPVKWRLDFDVHELQAVLATREERVRISLGRLYNMYQDGRLCSLRFVEVSENRVPLRLGWILSAPAAEELQAQAANQLHTAFQSGPTYCDGPDSSALHAASEGYAERLALGPTTLP